MQPRIEKLSKKKLVGISMVMSVLDNKTGQLWGQFGPKINGIKTRISDDKISMQVYPKSYFDTFNPKLEFEKWATVEVEDFTDVPQGMKTFVLGEGLYAVFDYKGLSTDNSIFQYIFSEWIPRSNYVLDDRPHFEVLGPNYRNNDHESEEEIWIPIKPVSKT
ncbi:GyrI-like domain-containing protein [Flagellimonas sp.]|uniref:GyrI-like domain-containing protein n=1 Tax=Flagellimonas sp. TaxID=2058762 RepID=UPI003F4A2BBF